MHRMEGKWRIIVNRGLRDQKGNLRKELLFAAIDKQNANKIGLIVC